MKKFFCVLIVISLILCFAGCETNFNPNIESSSDDKYIKIWTDEETGVQYVIYNENHGTSAMGGITPRLNADGTLYRLTEMSAE